MKFKCPAGVKVKVKCKKSEKHQLHLLWTYCVSRYGVISKIYLLPPGGSDAYTVIVFKWAVNKGLIENMNHKTHREHILLQYWLISSLKHIDRKSVV